MEYIVLNPSTATEEQLRAAIDCNNRTYRLMSSEITKLKRIAESARKTVKTDQEEPVIPIQPKTVLSKDEDFENEVEFYFSALKELSKDELESKIDDTLPSRKNYQYQRILLRIQAEIMRNIKDIKDFLIEEDVSLEDAVDFKDELLLERKTNVN